MYSTCIFCHSPLGTNDTIEPFPVGRRLAFDEAKGRLWVVCPQCHRWNLTPLEERWEAVEECERRFRATRIRTSTAHVGLARLPSGVELIRIGRPLRPELAVWRYGRALVSRWRRSWFTMTPGNLGAGSGGAFVVAAGTAAAGGFFPLAGTLALAAPVLGYAAYVTAAIREGQKHIVWGLSSEGQPFTLQAAHGQAASLEPADNHEGWALTVRGAGRMRQDIPPQQAIGLLGILMTYVNRGGGRTPNVNAALAALDEVSDAPTYFARAARQAQSRPWFDRSLADLPPAMRLAIEMAVHDRIEGPAYDGELAQLTQAWREAEEIAAIADDLLVPHAVEEALGRRARDQ